MKDKIITVLFGGAAGDGIKEAGISWGKLMAHRGCGVFISNEYPSLIRGGHNYCRVSFSAGPVFNDRPELDVAVAFNAESVTLHKKELKKTSLLLTEEKIPWGKWVKELEAKPITRTSAALGALCAYFGVPLADLEEIFGEVFKEKGLDKNLEMARRGYKHMKERGEKAPAGKAKKQRLLDGNQAFAEGMVAAGLEMYIAYPMTPASSILHFLAAKQKDYKIKVVHPENEIAVANMAVGAAYAGKRVATGTSGGGFALMEEAFSLAGISETPFLAALSQRPGPATGLPTGTGQADLQMARHAGHGEFPRVILAPGDPGESYAFGGAGVNLAWRFQVPVIVLLDKHLSESVAAADFSKIKITPDRGKLYHGDSVAYGRYQITKDGVSPLLFPGVKGAVVKANSYEHGEDGITTEDATMAVAQNDKRWRKVSGLARATAPFALKVYGDKKAKTAVIFWGSTKGAVLEAMKEIKKPLRAVQVLCFEPFPSIAFAATLKGATKIIAVEGNITGQLADIVREKTGIAVNKKILKYDGRPFNVSDLAKQLSQT